MVLVNCFLYNVMDLHPQKLWQILSSWAPKSLQTVIADMKLKTFASWKESYDKPRQHIKKQRHHFADKGPYSQSYAMVFPVVMYWCENWTIKKVECWRTDTFKLWCWRRLLRVPWTARTSNQSILKEINSEYPLKELLLKLNSSTLATWCIEPNHWKSPWSEAREEGDDRR